MEETKLCWLKSGRKFNIKDKRKKFLHSCKSVRVYVGFFINGIGAVVNILFRFAL